MYLFIYLFHFYTAHLVKGCMIDKAVWSNKARNSTGRNFPCWHPDGRQSCICWSSTTQLLKPKAFMRRKLFWASSEESRESWDGGLPYPLQPAIYFKQQQQPSELCGKGRDGSLVHMNHGCLWSLFTQWWGVSHLQSYICSFSRGIC